MPCLSMRSWANTNEIGQGNILKDGLEQIWMTRFKEQRFCKFFCCKDHCKNKAYLHKNPWWIGIKSNPEQEKKPRNPLEQIVYGVFPQVPGDKTIPWPSEIYVYAVKMYAVGERPIVTMYAVFNPNDCPQTGSSTTYTNDNIDKNPKKNK